MEKEQSTKTDKNPNIDSKEIEEKSKDDLKKKSPKLVLKIK